MKLLEYEAKELLRQSDVNVPASTIIAKGAPTNISLPIVLKSQVPIGGRGKAGGVVIVRQAKALKQTIDKLFRLKIHGFLPNKLLAEELLDIDRELYLSFIVNRELSCIELLAHGTGGIEIENHKTDDFFRRSINSNNFEALADELADYYDLADHAFILETFLNHAYRCFIDNDCLLLEINPLILTKNGDLVAGDAKITLDDAAAFRHKNWSFDEKIIDHNFVKLHAEGTVATIANGAGLAMATVDAITAAGLTPANFLDIGGTATPEKILTCFEQIMTLNHVTAIVINIFGGIVKCDDVAQAIISAKAEFPHLPTLYIRLVGNRADQAAALLARNNITLFQNFDDILGVLS